MAGAFSPIHHYLFVFSVPAKHRVAAEYTSGAWMKAPPNSHEIYVQ